jgi:hypothetical protein
VSGSHPRAERTDADTGWQPSRYSLSYPTSVGVAKPACSILPTVSAHRLTLQRLPRPDALSLVTGRAAQLTAVATQPPSAFGARVHLCRGASSGRLRIASPSTTSGLCGVPRAPPTRFAESSTEALHRVASRNHWGKVPCGSSGCHHRYHILDRVVWVNVCMCTAGGCMLLN